MNRKHTKLGNFESLEAKKLMTADMGVGLDAPIGVSGDADDRPTEEVAFYYNKIAFAYQATADGADGVVDGADFNIWQNSFGTAPGDAELRSIYVKIPGIPGDVKASDTSSQVDKNFIADSFSFSVEREMKESGEKGGTEDLNIGLGELQECSISKSMDMAAVDLVLASRV